MFGVTALMWLSENIEITTLSHDRLNAGGNEMTEDSTYCERGDGWHTFAVGPAGDRQCHSDLLTPSLAHSKIPIEQRIIPVASAP